MNELLTMLDSKYKRLEYIQSTGTQYIDTDFTPNNNTKWVLDAQFTQTNVEQYNGRICQAIAPSTSRQRFAIGIYNNKFSIVCGGSSGSSFNFVDTNRHLFFLDAKNGIGKIDNSQINLSLEEDTATDKIYLFARNINNSSIGNYCYEKVYSSQIYNNGTLVRNFIPVMRKSDNEIGMLDLVEGKFYPNAGTGKFTANLDTMYALIQGTPTVQDGRVSGFSDSNYLQLQQNLDSDLEMVIDFTTGDSIINNKVVFMNRSVFDLEVHNSGLIGYNWQNSSYNSVIPSTDYSTNTNYKVKIIRSGSIISFAYSKNGGAYISTATFTTTKTVTNPFTFGTSPVDTNRYFNGSINFNQSYIKIDDTKYKLQAVVGYSKVGTLTENPTGVFSGFSSSNYLNIDKSISFERIEMQVAFTLNGSSSQHQNICENAFFSILFTSYGYIATWNYNTSSWNIIIPSNKIISNGYYKIKVISKNNDLYVSYSINNTDFIYSMTFNNIHKYSARFLFGANPNFSERVFLGSIDMNNTYIKNNNKLWFNGLPNDN